MPVFALRVRRLRRLAVFVTAVVVACTSTTPKMTGPAGHWIGILRRIDDQWTLEMTLTLTGDSLHGVTDVSGASFQEHYVVSGVQYGDSVRLSMVPVEDATINVVGAVSGDQITGVLWFNAMTSGARNIVFVRQ